MVTKPNLNSEKALSVQGNFRWSRWICAGLACALVLGIYAWSARPGVLDSANPRAEDNYYNLLARGFQDGQLNVKREPPPGLADLSNPYDPALNTPYVWDSRYLSYEMSYFHGKLYLYFGVAPALVLFWPCLALTGHCISHLAATVIFSACGFLTAAGVLFKIWRRFFAQITGWPLICALLAMGLATGVLEMLASCDVYQVARSCAFGFTLLALATVWAALCDPKHQVRWLMLASLAYGLAVASRPSLLFGAAILLVPVAHRQWAGERGSPGQAGISLAAAIAPITLIGFGLMLYNDLRFGNPFEFGWHYQLTSVRNSAARQFSLHYFWFNVDFYFFHPLAVAGPFPFLHSIPLSPVPGGYCGLGAPYSGLLINDPIVWMALASPLAWRNRSMEEASVLRWFAGALVLLFVISVLTLCFFFSAGSGYETDFLPALMLLAVIGIFGLERAMAFSPVWRTFARCGWCLLLAWSVTFSVLAAVEYRAGEDYIIGNYFSNRNQPEKALGYFQKAVMLQGGSSTFHYACANALALTGNTAAAINEFHQALELNPNDAEANNNLGYTLIYAGKPGEAIHYFKRALEIRQSYQAWYNLACAYRRNGMPASAIECYQKSIQLQPRYLPAEIDEAWILATAPDASVRNGNEALALASRANEETGGANAHILRTLAAAYAEIGRFSDALLTARKALALASAGTNAPLVSELQIEIGHYRTNAPCRFEYN